MSNSISVERVLDKLDEYLHKNDYEAAHRHLLYWLDEAVISGDDKAILLIYNELMGLNRKLGNEQQALHYANKAIEKIAIMNIGCTVGAATTLLNCATVYKAFGKAEESIPLFERTKSIYESELSAGDTRLAGLYNNMALSLVDLNEFNRAQELYDKALDVLSKNEGSKPEQAITWLNKASAFEAEKGLENAHDDIESCLELAEQLLDSDSNSTDGNYAFVCEKCAGVFGYYGYFLYKKELEERANRIYEGT